MSQSDRYPVKVFWSQEDEGYIATAPDLPGCSAFGETQAEALAEVRDAIAAWIEAAQSAGNPVPQPSPSIEPKASGKFLVRAPKSLHQSLVEGAKAEGVSLNQHVVYLLTASAANRSIRHMCRETLNWIYGGDTLGFRQWATPEITVGTNVVNRVATASADAYLRIVAPKVGVGVPAKHSLAVYGGTHG